jgi:hypothetical protein
MDSYLDDFLDSEFMTGAYSNNISKMEFEMFPVYSSDTKDECSICMQELTSYIKTRCKHKFHKKCLKKWLFDSDRYKTNCPDCRSVIRTENNNKEEKEIIKEKVEKIAESVNTIGDSFLDIFSRLDIKNFL